MKQKNLEYCLHKEKYEELKTVTLDVLDLDEVKILEEMGCKNCQGYNEKCNFYFPEREL